MDDDCESEKQNKNGFSMFSFSNFLQSLRIRYPFCNNNEMDKFLLAYSSNFLLPFGCFLWALFLFVIK